MMLFNTNTWNRIRYTFHSWYYDLVVLILDKERRRAIEMLSPVSGSSILIVGAGTGLDLPYLKGGYSITATDLTPAMLRKLENRARKIGVKVDARVMDGQQLAIENNSFDYVILNLILAVIPNPVLCLQEAARVLKPGGQLLVFDKFLQVGYRAGILRKMTNVIARILFSDINRRFDAILSQSTDLSIVKSSPSLLNGMFMIYCLKKQ